MEFSRCPLICSQRRRSILCLGPASIPEISDFHPLFWTLIFKMKVLSRCPKMLIFFITSSWDYMLIISQIVHCCSLYGIPMTLLGKWLVSCVLDGKTALPENPNFFSLGSRQPSVHNLHAMHLGPSHMLIIHHQEHFSKFSFLGELLL